MILEVASDVVKWDMLISLREHFLLNIAELNIPFLAHILFDKNVLRKLSSFPQDLKKPIKNLKSSWHLALHH